MVCKVNTLDRMIVFYTNYNAGINAKWTLMAPYFILKIQVMESFAKAEKRKKPNPTELFKDVYEEIPLHLQKQMDSLKEHLSKNEDKYPTQNYEPWSWILYCVTSHIRNLMLS